jgi:hypothetical protein
MSWLTTPVMGWLEVASNAFYYLIGSAVFQCIEHQRTMKVKLFIFFYQSVIQDYTANMNTAMEYQ